MRLINIQVKGSNRISNYIGTAYIAAESSSTIFTLGQKKLTVLQVLVVDQRLPSSLEVHRSSARRQEDIRKSIRFQSDEIGLRRPPQRTHGIAVSGGSAVTGHP